MTHPKTVRAPVYNRGQVKIGSLTLDWTPWILLRVSGFYLALACSQRRLVMFTQFKRLRFDANEEINAELKPFAASAAVSGVPKYVSCAMLRLQCRLGFIACQPRHLSSLNASLVLIRTIPPNFRTEASGKTISRQKPCMHLDCHPGQLAPSGHKPLAKSPVTPTN